MTDIFISYSHKDRDYAHSLFESLVDKGYEPWIDDHIDYGDQWLREIETHIDECAAFIVIMTNAAKDSKWVQRELSRADRKKKLIIPLLLEGEEWLTLETTHLEDLRANPIDLPPLKFYWQLSRVVHKNPLLTVEQMEEEERRRKNVTSVSTIAAPLPIYDEGRQILINEIVRWSGFKWTNDFYGIARLAVSCEAEGSRASHQEGVEQLKRAYKLEPRIIDFQWMTSHFEWTEEYHNLLWQLYMDANFQNWLPK